MTAYSEYIKSVEWKVRAKAAKRRARWRCEVCGRTPPPQHLHAHHLTYERLGHERPGDIQVLCVKCHEKAHGIEPSFTVKIKRALRGGYE